ncbi:MAG: hypothetical protein J07HQW1_00694 [Haloquadratum walsbyi J07HQW1]|uniref:Uncharacterized protein n=1 Tax=Haloquadratum walsbyi J07HQW1 TaxID=1238424 RepID=U1PAS7_9EURY|nr:MAG: hypothetical protein J07HQW1_00694 [Haloquadratum walsbyi J07HQW1]
MQTERRQLSGHTADNRSCSGECEYRVSVEFLHRDALPFPDRDGWTSEPPAFGYGSIGVITDGPTLRNTRGHKNIKYAECSW